MERVAFIGLGAMGKPMVANLLAAGWPVSVHNRGPGKEGGLAGPDFRVCDSPADAVRCARMVVTMVPDDAAVEDVTFRADGILAHLAPGGVHISMSTIGVACSRRLAEAHVAAGRRYVAAPVFGRPDAAAAGALWIVAGGAPDAVESCRPLFETLGQGWFHVADAPEGANVVKLAGNFTIAAVLETLSEAFALLRKSGLDPRQFLDIVNSTMFRSPIYQAYGLMVLDEAFEPPGFKLRLGLKDVSLVLAAGSDAKVPMPTASLIRDNLLSGVARGMGEVDWSALGRVIADNAGVPPGTR
ncbi:MAG: NAD(P)-dependent oxidoreductase [Alphaproteobacteria bacterium]|nr:NAD(P)-dependent oxidoreductase [Alphaproteobacteria bacterium]